MRAACPVFVGEHDFAAFRGANCAAKTTVRRIYSMELGQGGAAIRPSRISMLMMSAVLACTWLLPEAPRRVAGPRPAPLWKALREPAKAANVANQLLRTQPNNAALLNIAGVAKALRGFTRDVPALIIKGGVLGTRTISADDARALADMPSREQVLAQLAGLLEAPLSQLAGLLDAPLRLDAPVRALVQRLGPHANDVEPVLIRAGDRIDRDELVRLRALIHLLSLEIFGESLTLKDFPRMKSIRGMGMTDRELLFQVELPLALGVIIAGVRVATVISVGVATVAAAIGADL